MRAVVFAYHNMGILGIRRLLDAGFEIPLVFSHDIDPHENVWFGSVSAVCREMDIPCVCPGDPNLPEWIERIKAAKPDIMFSFYYRYLLKTAALSVPALGAYNLHGSYLPQYRGRCPVNWVIVNGENFTGVTLHEMVEKPDAGPIVAQVQVEIACDDTSLSLFKKLELAADGLLTEILPHMLAGDITKTPMDLSKGSYYGGRKPEDSRICWNRPAAEIYNLIRAATRPYPGAFGFMKDEKITFWRAVPATAVKLAPGKTAFHEDTVMIGTGKGSLRLEEIEVNDRILKNQRLLKYFKDHEGEIVQ